MYLDAHVDIDPNGDWYHVQNGVATALNWFFNDAATTEIYTSAYAVQADGFDTVEQAYAAYQQQWN